MFLARWHWFAISLLLCVAVAGLYLFSTPKQYTRSASVMVKDDDNKPTSVSSELSNLGIFGTNTNIQNELLTFQSPTLMTEVVSRLHLNETYVTRQGLRNIEMYNCSPITVDFHDANISGLSFRIYVKSDKEYELSKFRYLGEKISGTVSGIIGTAVQTPVGIVTLKTTPHFTDDFISRTITYSKSEISRTGDAYATRLNASLAQKDATVISLSIEDASAQKSEDILNTLITVYNENWMNYKNQAAISTSHFITNRLGVIENELGSVDSDIATYKSENLLPDIQAASTLYMHQSAQNKQQLLDLNNQLSTAKYIRSALNGDDMSQPLSGSAGIASTSIAKYIDEFNDMVLNRNLLIANSSERNPLVADLTTSLRSMKQTIIQSIDNMIVFLNAEISSIQTEERQTTSQLASSPNQANYLLTVERQQKVKEQLYLYLLQKREENEISQAFTAYNTRVITEPRGSRRPTSPKMLNVALIALALGLILPAVTIFVIENLNTKVRGRKDVESLTIPLIGEIPQFYSDKKRSISLKKTQAQQQKNAILVKAGSRNAINESFRVIRSNIDFMTTADCTDNVFAITSFNPGSGKSFIAMNLATCFAIKNKKVLVIDGDLRHGTASIFVGSPQTGLSSYLAGQITDWHDIITTDEKYPNMHIAPIGTVPPNPTELLDNGKIEALIAELRTQYEYIFIDCPPIDIVADTQILERYVDRTIFIVRAGLLDRDMLPQLEDMYQNHRFKNLSFILNGVKPTGSRYGYHYGYQYGYHYGSYYANDGKMGGV